jgi:hypothetical protein
MDDLVNMMRKQSLICTDENNDVLAESFEKVSNLLRDVHRNSNLCYQYVLFSSKRYKDYLKKACFKGYFLYLAEEMNSFIRAANNVSKGGIDLHTLLLTSYFIDCELNMAIGSIYVEGCTNMLEEEDVQIRFPIIEHVATGDGECMMSY